MVVSFVHGAGHHLCGGRRKSKGRLRTSSGETGRGQDMRRPGQILISADVAYLVEGHGDDMGLDTRTKREPRAHYAALPLLARTSGGLAGQREAKPRQHKECSAAWAKIAYLLAGIAIPPNHTVGKTSRRSGKILNR